MKSFADTSFFLLVEQIIREDRPKDGPSSWSAHGVKWEYSRHVSELRSYGYTMEIYELAATGRSPWALLFVKEHWWAGRHGADIRAAQWAKPLQGERRAIMAWFKDRQKKVDG